jgi:hypothetical protein
MSPVSSYRAVIILYAPFGVVRAAVFAGLSQRAEAVPSVDMRSAATRIRDLSGIERSRGVVMKLSTLFALDSFGGWLRRPGVRGLLVPPAVWR